MDPILSRDEPPPEYDGGSWGPAEAGRIASRGGGWIDPGIETECVNPKV